MLMTAEFGALGKNTVYNVIDAARQLYEDYTQGFWRRRFVVWVSGKSAGLRPLPQGIRPGAPARKGERAGVQTVPIAHICGSENRCGDFDAAFRPLVSHNEERWISVAAARLRGRYLPPVELIRVGDVYYVRDGHHRISVARALGEEFIEASVTVYEG